MVFDVIIIGGGRSGLQAGIQALAEGKSCALVSYGRSTSNVDYSPFNAAGGTLLLGDKAVRAELSPEGDRVEKIWTLNLGVNTPLKAERYVLASGKFFGGGLVADMDEVREPLFGLDVWYEKDRSKWFDYDFFAPQPFMDFGVETDDAGHPHKNGKTIENLTVIGQICRKRI